MANRIVLKKSSVSSKVPLATDLEYGELALNYTDEKLYFKNASNVIKSLNVTPATLTIGTGLSGSSYNGTSAVTIAIDSTVATLSGTQTLTNKTIAAGSNTISGLTNSNLSGTAGITNANLANSSVTIGSTAVSLGATATTLAGLTSVTSTTFVGALTGNASTATTAGSWTTARTITLGGDLSGSVSINGSANVTLTATIAANSVALGTDTTGNYVAGATAGTGIAITGTAGEGWSPTISLLASDLTLFPTSNFKKSVRVATTANITLSGTQTIDGIAVVAGNRVLVKDQTTASQNGIYVVAAGAWTRSVAADASTEIDSAVVGVDEGTANGGLFYTNVFKSTDVVGTTAMPWYKVTTELDQTSTNTANKIVVRDGSGNFSAGTITAALSGNATTATTLQTARTIGGVSFNGSANINLPGVNTAGNQNTSGTAAISTAATLTTSSTASAFKVPFANTTASTTGNYGLLQDSEATFTYNPSTNTLAVGTVSAALSGNATTATTLQTARTINSVSFNGSANITVEPYVEDDEATNATRLITFVDNSTAGFKRLNEDSSLNYNPSTGTVITNGAFASTFALNKNTIDVSYSIPTGYNAVAAGPVVINNGITVTIPTGSTWVIV